MKNNNRTAPSIVLAALLGATLTAHAGRPLVVDDANVNDPGAGHIEAWFSRLPGKTNTWNVAPAYSPVNTPLGGLELSAILSRDTTTPATSTSLQARWRLTPSKPDGCNVGFTAGVTHTSGGSGNTPYLNGMATCNSEVGTVHVNLGANRPAGGPTLPTWGIAFERSVGAVTPHIEMFGQRHAKPGVQVGLRGDVAPGWQLDGTIGRQAGDTLVTVGFKRSF